MHNPIVWVHGDCLSPTNPALTAWPGAPAVFVWDDALLDAYQLSFKRVLFIYECLLELPVAIRRGDVAEQVAAFAREHSADGVATAESVSPRFRQITRQLRQTVGPLRIYRIPPFLDGPAPTDLKRFSRYWNVARHRLQDKRRR